MHNKKGGAWVIRCSVSIIKESCKDEMNESLTLHGGGGLFCIDLQLIVVFYRELFGSPHAFELHYSHSSFFLIQLQKFYFLRLTDQPTSQVNSSWSQIKDVVILVWGAGKPKSNIATALLSFELQNLRLLKVTLNEFCKLLLSVQKYFSTTSASRNWC